MQDGSLEETPRTSPRSLKASMLIRRDTTTQIQGSMPHVWCYLVLGRELLLTCLCAINVGKQANGKNHT